jgi:hypothetical protein
LYPCFVFEITVPAWLPLTLGRIHRLAISGQVQLTLKAQGELTDLGLGLDPDDVCDILIRLTPTDSAGRLKSEHRDEWLYLFKPTLEGMTLYLKVVLRSRCIVVSFHEDEGGDHDEA